MATIEELFARTPQRRKVFVSHYHGHQNWTDSFLRSFGEVFIPRTVGALDNDNFNESTNPEYVLGRITKEHNGDSTVTVMLVGRWARIFPPTMIARTPHLTTPRPIANLLPLKPPAARSDWEAP